jgi:GDP/UDP-N,N'-diacetylbacillosamine 2-epimerase (hydrolysing)
MTRKVCVITGSRADYGLLRWVMKAIMGEPTLTLQVIATGMHPYPEFGSTYQEIESDGIVIDRTLEILFRSNTQVEISKSMGIGMAGIADALDDLRPDLVVVLGDRFEIFAAVAAALVARIPIAHIHGGELTEGSFDDALRHSITKMSHLHFVSAEEYRNRVLQLGESPDRVLNVGGLGVENIRKSNLLSKRALEESMEFRFRGLNLLVSFHPVTLESDSGLNQAYELLDALEHYPKTGLLFTLSNADTGGEKINELIKNFVETHENAIAFASLGSTRFLSCMKYVDGIVGNSSSGILEAPTFQIGTIDIGNRQLGRIKAKSVISCEPKSTEIQAAIKKMYSTNFIRMLKSAESPFGNGGASRKIVDAIVSTDFEGLLVKHFVDFKVDLK